MPSQACDTPFGRATHITHKTIICRGVIVGCCHGEVAWEKHLDKTGIFDIIITVMINIIVYVMIEHSRNMYFIIWNQILIWETVKIKQFIKSIHSVRWNPNKHVVWFSRKKPIIEWKERDTDMYNIRKVTMTLHGSGASDRRLALFENIFPISRGVSTTPIFCWMSRLCFLIL